MFVTQTMNGLMLKRLKNYLQEKDKCLMKTFLKRDLGILTN
jgi:hypothetical protein